MSSRRLFTAYITAIVAVGGASLVFSLYELQRVPRLTEWTLFVLAGVLTGAYAVKVPGLRASISTSDTFFLAIAILFGPGPAAIAAAIDCGIASWRRNWTGRRLMFNATCPALSLWTAGHLFFLIAGTGPLVESPLAIESVVLPLAAMTVAWFLLNSWLTSAAIALEAEKPAFEIWKRFGVLWVNYAASASAAFCLVIITQYVHIAAAAAVLPLVLTLQLTMRSWLGRLDDAQQHVAKIDRLYLSTVETLATAIEAKDGVTHDHIRRVQIYAIGLARALGVSDDSTIKAIEAAALLHDTGKLAVPEHILNKPGKLTPVEFDQMKLHVDAGADILSAIDFPYPVVPIVRCHHENWDGTGYPRGVKGTDIPIGARILSVVDCFDALTSDRPYRRALSNDAALAILTERRGTMYDPLVVDTFVRVLPDIALRALPHTPHHQALTQISRAAASPVGTSAPPAPPPDPRTDVPDDLLALVSLARVVTSESSFADVLSLAGLQLRRVVPHGTCAIYLRCEDGDELVVEHALGPLAAALRGTSIRISQKLTGWVAAHRQTIVNSDAALDLCDIAPDARATCVSTPLLDGDALVGVLTVYGDASSTFSEEQGRMLQMVAPHLARMLATCRASAITVTPPAAARTAVAVPAPVALRAVAASR
jgi:putative nucleotidyltransferase with HDIG domain